MVYTLPWGGSARKGVEVQLLSSAPRQTRLRKETSLKASRVWRDMRYNSNETSDVSIKDA